jgi:TatD DNase family protein
MSFLIDTHAHLDFPELFSRLDEVLKNAEEYNVLKIISISTNLNRIQNIINISKMYPEIFFSVGVHPNEVIMNLCLSFLKI